MCWTLLRPPLFSFIAHEVVDWTRTLIAACRVLPWKALLYLIYENGSSVWRHLLPFLTDSTNRESITMCRAACLQDRSVRDLKWLLCVIAQRTSFVSHYFIPVTTQALEYGSKLSPHASSPASRGERVNPKASLAPIRNSGSVVCFDCHLDQKVASVSWVTSC